MAYESEGYCNPPVFKAFSSIFLWLSANDHYLKNYRAHLTGGSQTQPATQQPKPASQVVKKEQRGVYAQYDKGMSASCTKGDIPVSCFLCHQRNWRPSLLWFDRQSIKLLIILMLISTAMSSAASPPSVSATTLNTSVLVRCS